MGHRTHIDLSSEEPGPRAEPVINPMETMHLRVDRRGVRLLAAMHTDSRLGAGAVALLVLTAVLMCAISIGVLAFWVGLSPVGCMTAAAVAALMAMGMVVFVLVTRRPGHEASVDHAPVTRPPVNRPGKLAGRMERRNRGRMQ